MPHCYKPHQSDPMLRQFLNDSSLFRQSRLAGIRLFKDIGFSNLLFDMINSNGLDRPLSGIDIRDLRQSGATTILPAYFDLVKLSRDSFSESS